MLIVWTFKPVCEEFLYAKVKDPQKLFFKLLFFYSKSFKDENSDADFDIFQTFPMHMALFIVLIYIGICSLIFSFWEEWDYFTAFYFFFISLSTIGMINIFYMTLKISTL